LSELQKSSASSPGGPTPAEVAEMRRLEREIDQLNKEALVLMDL
jgi:hypothetical protein